MRIAFAAVFGALMLTGCNLPDPCAQLAPPTQAELAAVAAGAQVERDTPNGVECDLVMVDSGKASATAYWEAERE